MKVLKKTLQFEAFLEGGAWWYPPKSLSYHWRYRCIGSLSLLIPLHVILSEWWEHLRVWDAIAPGLQAPMEVLCGASCFLQASPGKNLVSLDKFPFGCPIFVHVKSEPWIPCYFTLHFTWRFQIISGIPHFCGNGRVLAGKPISVLGFNREAAPARGRAGRHEEATATGKKIESVSSCRTQPHCLFM